MSTLADIRTKVIAIVKDTSSKLALYPDHDVVDPETEEVITAGRLDSSDTLINPDDYDRKIETAILRYSKVRPNIAVDDVAGKATHDLDLPEGWSEGFSGIKSIEYPIGQVPEAVVEPDKYYLYQSTAGKVIRLTSEIPGTDESVRVSFTIPRSAETIPPIDEDCLCNLAAALCLEDLANAAVQTNDPTINADVVNYRTKSSEFAARAKRLMQLYKEHLGLKEDDTTPPAAAVGYMDLKYPGGSERLTHPRLARRMR